MDDGLFCERVRWEKLSAVLRSLPEDAAQVALLRMTGHTVEETARATWGGARAVGLAWSTDEGAGGARVEGRGGEPRPFRGVPERPGTKRSRRPA